LDSPIACADEAWRATKDRSTTEVVSETTKAVAAAEAVAIAFVLMYIVDRAMTSLSVNPDNVGNIVANIIVDFSEKCSTESSDAVSVEGVESSVVAVSSGFEDPERAERNELVDVLAWVRVPSVVTVFLANESEAVSLQCLLDVKVQSLLNAMSLLTDRLEAWPQVKS